MQSCSSMGLPLALSSPLISFSPPLLHVFFFFFFSLVLFFLFYAHARNEPTNSATWNQAKARLATLDTCDNAHLSRMDVHPATQEERIAERRERIQKRLEKERGVADGGSRGADSSRVVATEGPKRAEQALEEQADLFFEASQAVADVKENATAYEAQRREQEEVFSEERKQKRAAQVEESVARHGALTLGFESLYGYDVPHDLHDAIEEQKRRCEELLAIKKTLIDELQKQIEQKEEDYVQLLRDSRTRLNDLVGTMHSKAETYMDQYARQLSEVEAAYTDERRQYLEQCAAEIQQLVKTRRTKETEFRKRREVKVVEAQEDLEEKYEDGYEEYNGAKRSQLGDIHSLRQELEKSKADFLLNGERLNYNLQVLRERVKENKAAQSQYKRKLAKLQDTLSTLIARYQESEKRYQRANRELTTQLHRVDTQYQDLQKKFQLFEKADKDKYRQLWNMHNQKCKALVHRCLQADRVVFEELLRVPWQPPEMNFWPEQSNDVDGIDEDGEEEAPQDLELDEPALMLLQILRSQAPFLVDEDVEAAIRKVEGTTEEQAAIEGILTTLKVKRTEDVKDLLEYFTVESEDETVALINPQEALRALNTYLQDRKRKEAQAAEKAASSSSKNLAKEIAKQKEKRRQAERGYWRRLAECVPTEHIHVWEALEEGLEKYLAQLQQRKALIEETDTLRAQNDELRALLGQYMHSNINYELYAPPALVMSAHAMQ